MAGAGRSGAALMAARSTAAPTTGSEGALTGLMAGLMAGEGVGLAAAMGRGAPVSIRLGLGKAGGRPPGR